MEGLAEHVLRDCSVRLTGLKTKESYPKSLRMVDFYDTESRREFRYFTNAKRISATRVAELYRNRWQVELFFKWLKQHLRIKKFWGTSENAVRIQIYIAMATYCLVAVVQHDMKLKRSTYEMLQILGISLTDKTPIKELLNFSSLEKAEKAGGEAIDLFDSLLLC